MIDRNLLRLKLRDALPRSITGPTVPPFVICRVDPREIRTYLEYTVLRKYRSAGRIEPGEWDLQAKPLSESPKYRLLRGYYGGSVSEGNLTPERLREAGYPEREARSYAATGYGAYLDELFASIRERGIELEYDTAQAERTADRYDQVAVNVGRDGALIFNSCGFHRLVASQLVGLEEIPVRINAIHSRWWRTHRDAANPLDEHPQLTYVGRIPIRWRDVLARA
ncbi:hypothetical protein QA600_10980 [Natronococcus sp. A-GB1]|uniref:hypothetical protein n=1 Tax=Natronococcus sp. A-GB1 TaxID=3037648 RepID=UPI00241F77F7|nr:hypothetical protein [Natronococcus sp. A-GB1]MDG5759864.1 hypothetical protein [Natronococcus sp. A-GB1]